MQHPHKTTRELQHGFCSDIETKHCISPVDKAYEHGLKRCLLVNELCADTEGLGHVAQGEGAVGL